MDIRNNIFNSPKATLNFNKFGNSFNIRKRNRDAEDNLIQPKKHNGIRRSTVQNFQSSLTSNKNGLLNFIENKESELLGKHYTSAENNMLKYYQSVKSINSQDKLLFPANLSSKCTTSHSKRSKGGIQMNKNDNILSRLSASSHKMKKNKTLLRVKKYLESHPKLKQRHMLFVCINC